MAKLDWGRGIGLHFKNNNEVDLLIYTLMIMEEVEHGEGKES